MVKSRQGIESLTEEHPAAIQATELGHASKDLYEAIERGEYPQWELNVQIMSDDGYPELDFDPLDDTKSWPEDVFPLRPVGVMTLHRTFSYSDTQRYRVGPNYLQLPVNAPREDVQVRTNQDSGQMSYGVDNRGGNPHINFEPSSVAGPASARPTSPTGSTARLIPAPAASAPPALPAGARA